jgi:hypothetical protein
MDRHDEAIKDTLDLRGNEGLIVGIGKAIDQAG